MKFASVIVEISHEKLDRGFWYRIPDALLEKVHPGVMVTIPFGKGNRHMKGYVKQISEKAFYPVEKMKDILEVCDQSLPIESRLIALADWIHCMYGGTMNQALKTVVPVKNKVQIIKQYTIALAIDKNRAEKYLFDFSKNKTMHARKRLLEILLEKNTISKNEVIKEYHIGESTIKGLCALGIIQVTSNQVFRNPTDELEQGRYQIVLNEKQQKIAEEVCESIHFDDVETMKDCNGMSSKVHLIHGITGSGKTEIYMELIDRVLKQGRQAIVLIPEIALTFQTMKRFYERFGDRIAIIHSKLSGGERYDQFTRAKNGEADIVIGARSALFAPLLHLGLIIIDEEHESSYKSETVPKYHARETAIRLAELSNATVVLGSATPSVESYYQAMNGNYVLHTLEERAKKESSLAEVSVVDLREELKAGNKSIFSRKLREKIQGCLERKEQIMLFINRRGYAGFVSCRSCGEAIKCPHCDVSLKYHKNGKLICHYCGYETYVPKQCPSCGSRYISTFGTGTQKVEELVKAQFPMARTLRMDFDTTRNKNAHQMILEQFASGKADILVGTQMIVKGHDFPNVTLVGIIAADLSLYASDYKASERTFELLTQAAGRAGRADKKGEVVIQTYAPDHYSIMCAKEQDYKSFYNHEIAYRRLLSYPPVAELMAILFTDEDEKRLEAVANRCAEILLKRWPVREGRLLLIGPADASISKINDCYRKVIYLKSKQRTVLEEAKDLLENTFMQDKENAKTNIAFDLNPLGNY